MYALSVLTASQAITKPIYAQLLSVVASLVAEPLRYRYRPQTKATIIPLECYQHTNSSMSAPESPNYECLSLSSNKQDRTAIIHIDTVLVRYYCTN